MAMRRTRIMGRAARCSNRNPSLRGRKGLEPSAAVWVAEPGQRRILPDCRPTWRSAGLSAVSRPPAGVSVNWKALTIGEIRAKWPLAS